MLVATAEIAYDKKAAEPHGTAPRGFYRPELDALRLLAFLAVYVCHSIPNSIDEKYAGTHSQYLIQALISIKEMGNFGVCLFFLLSAFLITELLRIERQKTGSIHLKAFYLRRVLRIWPLYFGITSLYAFGGHFFPALHIESNRIWSYYLLIGNWYIAFHPWLQTPLRALWSISVEEQFYLGWPWLVMKLDRSRLFAISIAVILISLIWIYITSVGNHYAYVAVWVSSVTQLQYFACGVLLALVLKGRLPKIEKTKRIVMAFLGVLLWWGAAAVAQIKRPGIQMQPYKACAGYMLVAIGCVLLFCAFLGVAAHKVPSWIAYLGKISFGLYVFHETAFLLVDEAQKHMSYLVPMYSQWLTRHLFYALIINKTGALMMAIAIAMLSYRFYESPFLRLKQRITFVESRGI